MQTSILQLLAFEKYTGEDLPLKVFHAWKIHFPLFKKDLKIQASVIFLHSYWLVIIIIIIITPFLFIGFKET